MSWRNVAPVGVGIDGEVNRELFGPWYKRASAFYTTTLVKSYLPCFLS